MNFDLKWEFFYGQFTPPDVTQLTGRTLLSNEDRGHTDRITAFGVKLAFHGVDTDADTDTDIQDRRENVGVSFSLP